MQGWRLLMNSQLFGGGRKVIIMSHTSAIFRFIFKKCQVKGMGHSSLRSGIYLVHCLKTKKNLCTHCNVWFPWTPCRPNYIFIKRLAGLQKRKQIIRMEPSYEIQDGRCHELDFIFNSSRFIPY